MCTLSVLLTDDGFLVAMNRDERRDRPLGAGPRRYRVGAHTVAHPTDVEAGGTWFGASDAGFVAAVLNNYQAHLAFAERPLSRGAIPMALLQAQSPAEARATLGALDPALYRPFRAVLILPGQGVLVGESDGEAIRWEEQPWVDFLLVSSGLDEPRVRDYRRALFDDLRATDRDPEALRRLHFQQNFLHPELGFSMERPEARSVSYSEVQVRGDRWVLRHLEEPPVRYDAATRARIVALPLTEL